MTGISGDNYLGLVFIYFVDRHRMSGRGNIGEPQLRKPWIGSGCCPKRGTSTHPPPSLSSTTIMSDGESACANPCIHKIPHTTTADPVSAIPLLAHALTKIRSTPPRVITSPPTQPRRAAVALVIRVTPPRNFSQILPCQTQPSLQEFFQLDWVNAPGAVAEILFLKRENPGEDTTVIANNRVNDSPGAHVAFPGGRAEEGDEGGCYTGA